MAHYRIKQWEQYQHYKDRSPPWIKLHRSVLTSRTWVSASDEERVLAVACMLIAAETDNKIPLDAGYLRRVAYLNSEPDFAALVKLDFIEFIDDSGAAIADASAPQAGGTKCSSEESRGEERRGASAPSAKGTKRKAKTHLPENFTLTGDLREYAESKLPQVDGAALFESFCGKARAKSWVYADWRQAWQEFCRNAAPNSGHWSSGQYPRKVNGSLTPESLQEKSGWM